MKIAVASDHAAYDFKLEIIKGIKEQLGYDCDDLGPYSTERTHYPIWAQKAACAVADGKYDRAILLCDSGVGMCIAANKVKGIRAVVCSDWYSAKFSRLHNNANVLTLGKQIVGRGLALSIIDVWLKSEFEPERHQIRIDMLAQMDDGINLGEKMP
jgi:ribose 5-phosphate isomerase B